MVDDKKNSMVDDLGLLNQMVSDWESSYAYSEVEGGLKKTYQSFVDDLRTLGLQGCVDQRVRGVTAINGCDAHPTHAPEAKALLNNRLSQQEGLDLKVGFNLLRSEYSIEHYNEA